MINNDEITVRDGGDSSSSDEEFEEEEIEDVNNTNNNNGHNSMSKPTVDKSLAAKMHIEQYYSNYQLAVKERGQRRKELEQKIADLKLTSKEQQEIRKEHDKKETDYTRSKRLKLTKADFEILKVIGRGAFGEVSLVKQKATSSYYAMKRLKKSEMIKKEQAAHVRAERDVLATANTDWVVKLYNSFQDPDYLYLVMEYLPGGDMMSLLIKYDIFTEDQARFYIAQTLLAIDSVHQLDFIHRDIKPDNLLLDQNGHVKLCDLGLCTGFHRLHSSEFYSMLVDKSMTVKKKLIEATPLTQTERIASWKKSRRALAYSAVGTPDYTAPEVFLQAGYGKEVDWWSLGVILYEMVIGHPPFLSDDATETCLKILNCKDNLHFDNGVKLSRDCKDLIQHLVCESKDRLKTATDIKAHPFFKGVNWENIRKVKAPFIPELKSATDTSNFDDYQSFEEDEELEKQSSTNGANSKVDIKNHQNIKDKDLAFIGFTYKGFDAIHKSPQQNRRPGVDTIFSHAK
ncbi:putative protein serine/threonine kinase [Tieghemostelium lacteum]|uniref:non-specific serine/threonine protein kinase n=1 Tax=Tieghemostelium lacteum TaxID=361077 RepID=A0A151Z929_TIELA|nr:putative protein serine/threonine kinase [Tieghemostelium lacteum]|eukprot:KYQ90455.1 putative protein serine/threonine kinase [Tieghemostelium lacteum]